MRLNISHLKKVVKFKSKIEYLKACCVNSIMIGGVIRDEKVRIRIPLLQPLAFARVAETLRIY